MVGVLSMMWGPGNCSPADPRVEQSDLRLPALRTATVNVHYFTQAEDTAWIDSDVGLLFKFPMESCVEKKNLIRIR